MTTHHPVDCIPAEMDQQKAWLKHAALPPAAVGGPPAGPWVQPQAGAQVQKPGPVVGHQPCGEHAGLQQHHWSGGGTGRLGAKGGSLPHLASHAGSGRAAGGALVGLQPEVTVRPFSVLSRPTLTGHTIHTTCHTMATIMSKIMATTTRHTIATVACLGVFLPSRSCTFEVKIDMVTWAVPDT